MTRERLQTCDFIGWSRDDQLIERLGTLGLRLSHQSFPFVCGSHLVQWELVKRGLGVGVQADVIGDREPGVERALTELEPVVFPVWLVSHRELHTSRRVRRVFDLLAEGLAGA
jgi:DNA-binding transcriptional LysR family regulator